MTHISVKPLSFLDPVLWGGVTEWGRVGGGRERERRKEGGGGGNPTLNTAQSKCLRCEIALASCFDGQSACFSHKRYQD